jgi:hypothetical protein
MAPERSPQIIATTTGTPKTLMTQKTQYEIIISQKLEQLPLPNLQDAIWSRIEDQLDLDMPTDDNTPNGPETPQSPDWRNLLYQAGPFAVIVALVTIFLVNKSQRANNKIDNTNTAAPSRQVDRKNVPGSGPPAAPQNKLPNRSGATVNYPASAKEPVIQPVDSVLQQSVVATATPAADSVQKAEPTLVQQAPLPELKDAAPKKKPRGVKGLSDSDYRLVPRKDSTQGGN